MISDISSSGLARWLAILAILMKIVLAPGTMLAATPSGGLMVTLCTSDGMVSGWVDADGTLHRAAPDDQHNDDQHSDDAPCAFSALTAAALTPDIAPTLFQPAHASSPVALFVVRPGAGLAAPPPPATGPPAIL